MGKHQRSDAAAAAAACHFYRITPKGRAVAAREFTLRSRYLIDLLQVLETCGRGVPECELRQFMPPASLGASIAALLALGLIEYDDSPPVRPKPRHRPALASGLPLARLSPL